MANSAALSNDDPRMIAWDKFKQTESFTNAMKWAKAEHYDDLRKISNEMRDNHLQGALWACFLAGYESGERKEQEHA